MTDDEATRRTVRAAVQDSRYAVLATESEGQPHASLMAFAAIADGRELVFATYRGTRKHRNLVANPRVALFIDHRETAWLRANRRLALTALGSAREVPPEQWPSARAAFLARHHDLQGFVDAADCVLVRRVVEWYQVAGGIDEVGWCSAASLPAAAGGG